MHDLVTIDPAGVTAPAEAGERLEGTLLSWGWTDQDAGEWRGLVRFRPGRLAYEQWVSGEYVTRV